jgi:AcrR family transcriptional regulator
MTRQAERLAATRSAILRAASDLFGRQGYAATSVDQIAAAAGVAKGAVYHHFASKERLFEPVLEATTAALARQVMVKAQTASDVWDAVAVATEAYFELASTGAAAQIVLKDGPVVLGWERWRKIDAAHFGAAMPSILQAAIAQGLIASQPVEPLARAPTRWRLAGHTPRRSARYSMASDSARPEQPRSSFGPTPQADPWTWGSRRRRQK